MTAIFYITTYLYSPKPLCFYLLKFNLEVLRTRGKNYSTYRIKKLPHKFETVLFKIVQ